MILSDVFIYMALKIPPLQQHYQLVLYHVNSRRTATIAGGVVVKTPCLSRG